MGMCPLGLAPGRCVFTALTLVLTLASLVQTDMGNAGARAAGKEKAPRTLLESTETTSYIVSRLCFRHTCYRPPFRHNCVPYRGGSLCLVVGLHISCYRLIMLPSKSILKSSSMKPSTGFTPGRFHTGHIFRRGRRVGGAKIVFTLTLLYLPNFLEFEGQVPKVHLDGDTCMWLPRRGTYG